MHRQPSRTSFLRNTTLAISLLSAGCATQLRQPHPSQVAIEEEREAQRVVALQSLLDRQSRVARVASRLSVAGAELCGDDVRPVFGLMWVTSKELPEEYRLAAARLGLSEQVRVWTVVAGLPAESAGLRTGDLILAAGGKSLEDGKDLSSAIHDTDRTGVISVRIRSSGESEERDVTVHGASACSYPVTVGDQETINAMADGDQVVITKGMMRFATTDDELALVIGHEIAHNALHHMRQNKAMVGVGAGLGLLLDVAAALGGVNTGGAFTRLGMQAGSGVNRVFSVDHEQDADYMAIYLSERAGFRIDEAPNFWRRMAADQPKDIDDYMGRTHPSSPERSASLQAAIAEIAQKKEAGLPLLPERE
jgi:Zn-dependent protease with chaperone function